MGGPDLPLFSHLRAPATTIPLSRLFHVLMLARRPSSAMLEELQDLFCSQTPAKVSNDECRDC